MSKRGFINSMFSSRLLGDKNLRMLNAVVRVCDQHSQMIRSEVTVAFDIEVGTFMLRANVTALMMTAVQVVTQPLQERHGIVIIHISVSS